MEPLTFEREALARLPLAEATLLVLRQAALPQNSLELFDRLKGPCYERLLGFDVFVKVIADALITHHGSGRQSFEEARRQGILPVSNESVYGKLRRLPLPLSEALLRENSARLRPLLPAELPSPVPASLRHFQLQVADGKILKRLAKKLKVLRGTGGGVLGGKGLVALDLHTGMATAMASAADGLVNDAALVGDLVAQVRPLLAGPILWLGDCQFCNLTQPRQFQRRDEVPEADWDHFLVRYNPRTHFHPDPEASFVRAGAALEGTDRRGRRWRQEWGWLGTPGAARSLYVRRITLYRPGARDIVLVSDLLDPVAVPAEDLLEVYLERWGIERVFQKITEVFSLNKLISSTPQGTVFQLGFCLLLYNVIQVVRGHVASGQGLKPEEVSTEMLFVDVQDELTALAKVVGAEGMARLTPERTPAQTQARLRVLLGKLWKPIWRKTTNKKCRAHQPKAKARQHTSAQRVLEKHKSQRAPQLVLAGP